MGLFWCKRGTSSHSSASGRSAGSVAAAEQGREMLLRAQPAMYQVGGVEEGLGVAFLFAGMYVFPLS